jgi:hypothetical protein
MNMFSPHALYCNVILCLKSNTAKSAQPRNRLITSPIGFKSNQCLCRLLSDQQRFAIYNCQIIAGTPGPACYKHSRWSWLRLISLSWELVNSSEHLLTHDWECRVYISCSTSPDRCVVLADNSETVEAWLSWRSAEDRGCHAVQTLRGMPVLSCDKHEWIPPFVMKYWRYRG